MGDGPKWTGELWDYWVPPKLQQFVDLDDKTQRWFTVHPGCECASVDDMENFYKDDFVQKYRDQQAEHYKEMHEEVPMVSYQKTITREVPGAPGTTETIKVNGKKMKLDYSMIPLRDRFAVQIWDEWDKD